MRQHLGAKGTKWARRQIETKRAWAKMGPKGQAQNWAPAKKCPKGLGPKLSRAKRSSKGPGPKLGLKGPSQKGPKGAKPKIKAKGPSQKGPVPKLGPKGQGQKKAQKSHIFCGRKNGRKVAEKWFLAKKLIDPN